MHYYYDTMALILCGAFLHASLQSPFVIDSTIYTVDMPALTLVEQKLKGPITDYCIDDFLYALTPRYLYKIDPDVLSICDQVPLPQHFNYLSTNTKKLMLITSGEIIILDKTNLAFEEGIGIEHGDYRPLTNAQGAGIAQNDETLYLIADSGPRSVIKVFDLGTGALIKTRSAKKICYYEYNARVNTLLILDDSGTITFYDGKLQVLNTVQLSVAGLWFERHAHGYLVYNHEGVFLTDRKGKTIDFQPLPIPTRFGHGRNVFLTSNAVIRLDSLTLRPQKFITNHQGLMRLIHVEGALDCVLAQDREKFFYAVNLHTLALTPMTRQRTVPLAEKAASASSASDSVWYVQLGAFTDLQNAQALHDTLSKQNIPGFIDSTDLYRVKVGGFIDKAEARSFIEISGLAGWLTCTGMILQSGTREFMVNEIDYRLESGIIRRKKNEKNH